MLHTLIDQRRRRVIDAVVNVIAREGLDAATIRRIAAEVGYSTTIITHYFSDKHDLLLSAYRMVGEFSAERFEEVVARDPADLVTYLLSMSARDEATMALWRAYIAIWDKSLRDKKLAAELRSWTEETLGRIELFIENIRPECPDRRDVATRLIAMVHGISIQRLFDRESWPTERIRDVLMSEVELLLGVKA